MHRRSLLKGILPFTTTALAGCSMPFQSSSQTADDIESFMTFLEATPADQPLVIEGLSGEKSGDVWGRLFTQQPQTDVFTERITDVSPHMQSQLHADRYGERFLVLVQMRFSSPHKLFQAIPHKMVWVEPTRLRIPLEARGIEEPSKELQSASSVIATTLLIFKYGTTSPESAILPVRKDGRERVSEIIAE